MEFSYEQIKELARQSGRKVTDLIALAAQNDPFYQGTPATRALAEWFAEIYYARGWRYIRNHIRRCHYQIVSFGVNLPDGKPYENTMACWDTLLLATKAARYLGLVEMDTFDDRRNDEPISYIPTKYDPTLYIADYVYSSDVELPRFPTLPGYSLEGYQGNQTYHLEIWCEKTTMNDVLQPLCEQYGAVLQTGAGELSITAARLLSERLKELQKPTRILYVSDFDPAGQSMPVAVSRKLEYFIRNENLDVDVRLFPVVLTIDQVRQYRLPRTPIKETETRKAHFEAQFGTGAVELDAMEALHAGELERIMRRLIERYYDPTLADRTTEAREEVERVLNDIRRTALANHKPDIDVVRDELSLITRDFGPRMQTYSEHIRDLWQAISDELREQAPDLGDYERPEAYDAEELGEGLYNSERAYMAQIDAYKAFQGK
jgi:hypothetical protein